MHEPRSAPLLLFPADQTTAWKKTRTDGYACNIQRKGPGNIVVCRDVSCDVCCDVCCDVYCDVCSAHKRAQGLLFPTRTPRPVCTGSRGRLSRGGAVQGRTAGRTPPCAAVQEKRSRHERPAMPAAESAPPTATGAGPRTPPPWAAAAQRWELCLCALGLRLLLPAECRHRCYKGNSTAMLFCHASVVMSNQLRESSLRPNLPPPAPPLF